MPQTIRKKIFESTATGLSPAIASLRPDVASYADARGYTVRSVIVRVSGGAGSPTFTIEGSGGSPDGGPPPAGTWATLACRPPGNGAYGIAAQTAATGNTIVLHLDPSDYIPWLRLNVGANAGAALVEAWAELEV